MENRWGSSLSVSVLLAIRQLSCVAAGTETPREFTSTDSAFSLQMAGFSVARESGRFDRQLTLASLSSSGLMILFTGNRTKGVASGVRDLPGLGRMMALEPYLLIPQFEAILNANGPERDVQEWLEKYPIVFGNKSAVIPQAALGSQYQVDFMVAENITVGLTWTLVELKSPTCNLFRADGLPTDTLNSAIHQVELYQSWIAENISYARTLYPDILQPKARVVIGRRASFSADHKRLLKQMNLRHEIEVMTYDRLLDSLRYTTSLELRAHNQNTKAYSRALGSVASKLCFNILD